MQRNGVLYTVGFAALVCAVCSILVSSAAVGLRSRQEANEVLARQRKVLSVSGLMEPGERLSADQVREQFEKSIQPKIVVLETGEYDDSADPLTFDQRRETKDPATSIEAPANEAGLMRLPKRAMLYHVVKDGQITRLILPVTGRGLWSQLYGYLALEKDATTVGGITFYEHGETPGLGGEIENPRWTSLWVGRKAYDENWAPAITVIKGQAGTPAEDPHQVDGLSGATLTSRGVSNLVSFWLSDAGFGTYLKQFRQRGS